MANTSGQRDAIELATAEIREGVHPTSLPPFGEATELIDYSGAPLYPAGISRKRGVVKELAGEDTLVLASEPTGLEITGLKGLDRCTRAVRLRKLTIEERERNTNTSGKKVVEPLSFASRSSDGSAKTVVFFAVGNPVIYRETA